MFLPKLPEIPDDERTPLVVVLLEIIQLQQEQIQRTRQLNKKEAELNHEAEKQQAMLSQQWDEINREKAAF